MVTITLGTESTYEITANETVTVTVPATAVAGTGAIVATPTFTILPSTAALTGTLSDGATEDQIVAGGETLIITLTNDTWDATIGADNSKTTDLINGLDSGGSEGTGWDAVVKANLDFGDVTRTSNTVVTITLGAEATYDVTASETITVTVPATAVAGTGAIVATPTFTVLPRTAALTGTLSDGATEDQIVAGGETLIITLTNDTWDATIGADNSKTTDLINGLDSGGSEGTGWDAVVKANLDFGDVTRTSNTVVTITLGAEATYDVTASETITVTVPATAVAGTGAIVATPTFTVLPRTAALTGTLSDGATEDQIVAGGETLIITLTNDTWDATIGASNSKTTDLINGLDSAQAEATGWDAVVKANLDFGDVTRTSNTVVTITLGAEATYDVTASETITVTVPATAVAGTGAIVATPTFTVLPRTAALTGTLSDGATEDQIVAGGETLIITLTNDTWDATIGADNSKTTALINGIDSAQSEAAGWDAVVKANLDYNDVVRTSDTVVTITLGAEATYFITATETMTVTVPATALAGTDALVATPTFNVTLPSSTVTTDYNFQGVTTANHGDGTNPIAIEHDSDVFPWTTAADQNDSANPTDAEYVNISADNTSQWATDDPGSSDEMAVTYRFYLQETVSNITNIEITWNGNTDGGTANHSIWLRKDGFDEFGGTSTWVQLGTALSITQDVDTDLIRNLTSDFSTYVNGSTGQFEFVVTTSRSSDDMRTNYVQVAVTSTSATAALTGTLSNGATEDQIVAGGETLIVYLTDETWDATMGADNTKTTDLINGIDSAQAEGTGWDAVVKANLDYNDVVRSSARTVTITLGAESTYAITANETITVTVPATAVAGSDPITATPTFDIGAKTAVLTGTLSDNASEPAIVAGGETLIITLTSDTWDATIGADNAKTTALIAGIDSAQAEAAGWDAVVKANLDYNDVARTSDTVVTITLGAEASYDITATETITVTVPATAVAGAGAIVATPTFDITILQPFDHRKSITVDRTKVALTTPTPPTTLSNFPLLVSLTDVNLRTKANDPTNGRVENANGYDILFRATDDATCGGTGPCTLDHEIESYDGGASAGTLVAWVRLPSINTNAASTDTVIYMYYGNADISVSLEDADGVWDTNYKGVWHLGDGDSTATDFYQDSTANNAHGTLTDADADSVAIAGKAGGAYDFNGDADYIDVANFSQYLTSAMTISGWVKVAATPTSHGGYFGIRNGSDHYFYVLNLANKNDLEQRFHNSTGGGVSVVSISAVTPGNWLHVALTYDGDTLISYVDGQFSGQGTNASGGSFTSTVLPFRIGSDGQGALVLDGIVDEVRASNIGRSADWVKTSYNNQNDPGDIGAAGFYTVGSEDTSPLTAVELITFSGIAYDRAVLLEWRTGYEIDNLGFNLYREIDTERTKLTPSPIAGSGLLAQRGTAVTSVQAYAWWDHQATVATPNLLYWLEDLDFNGTSTWHGPMTPVAGGHLIDVGPPAPWEGLVGESSGSLSGLADAQGASRRTFLTDDQPPRLTRSATTTGAATPLETQWAVAQQSTVKIGVRRTGWVRVTQATLVAAGLDPTVDPRRLQVFADGIEQAVTVTGEADGQFDPADTIGFYGRGVDTAFTDIRVYWVVAGTQSGRRILSTTSTLSAQSTPTTTPTAPPVTQTPVSAATPTAPATSPPTAPPITQTSPPTATATPRPAAPVTPAQAATPTRVTATATPTPTPPAPPAPVATARPRPAPPRAATPRATPPRPQRRRSTPEPAAVPVTTPENPAPVAPAAESTPAPVFPTVDDVARARASTRGTAGLERRSGTPARGGTFARRHDRAGA